MRARRVGPSTEPGSDTGLLVTREHRARVVAYVSSELDEGAEPVVDGRGVSVAGHEQGLFLGGGLIDRIASGMRI